MKLPKFNNILICGHPEHVDVKLLEHAAILAKQNPSRVKVVHVVTDYPKDVKTWWNVCNPEKLRNQIVKEREGFLDGLVETLKKLEVDEVTRELLWGEPAVEISTEVLSGKHDLVMLVSRPSGKLNNRALGYSSTELLRQCPTPIWVARSKVTKRTQRIVACLAGSNGDVRAQGDNARILDHAVAIAVAEGAEVHVVHVMPRHDSYVPITKLKGKRLDAGSVVNVGELRDELIARCNNYLESSGIVLACHQAHVFVGTPTEVIPEFVESKGADLVVMGTAARRGISGVIIGNAVKKVIPHVTCPVLVVKPDMLTPRYDQPARMAKASAA